MKLSHLNYGVPNFCVCDQHSWELLVRVYVFASEIWRLQSLSISDPVTFSKGQGHLADWRNHENKDT